MCPRSRTSTRSCHSSCHCWHKVAFFSQAFAYLDAQDFVELYFPYIATTPALFQEYYSNLAAIVGNGSCLYTDDGNLSAVGDLMF